MKHAMVELAKKLPEGAQLVSSVHDELIVEAPQELGDQVKQLVDSCMVEAMTRLFPEVPIEVDVKICQNCGEK